MCTFCSDLPPTQKGGNHKRISVALFLKPNDPQNQSEKYRFRILNFRSQDKNDRAYPFISRYVHNHWGMNDNGYKIVDDCVVCPSSSYIDSKNDPELGFVDTYRELKLKDKKPTWDAICPICRHVAEAWNAWKSSGRTDSLALERIRTMTKQFQAAVPVYVVNDPVNEKNNGRFKALIFSNKDEYKQFIDLVNRERAKISASGNQYSWCNGTNAVDLYLRVDKVPVIYNEGKPNEKQGVAKKITKMAFGSTHYDLIDNNGSPIITKEAIDRFEFDEQYYIKNSKLELEEFYKKYFGNVAKNIPDEDEEVFSSAPAPVQPVKQKSAQNLGNPAAKPESTASRQQAFDVVESMPFDDDLDSPSGNPGSEQSVNAPIKASSVDMNEILDELF